MEGTEALRCAAPHWSLDGDRQLLGVLQGLHQRIVCACEETDRKLGALVAALDDAGLHLRNVNNKFMALSNSQFIESRVYEDDADIVDSAPAKNPPTPASVESELSNLRRGLETLERLHESVTILPSDSETDSEDEDSARVVLKPKDVYAHRPLPHIIGSHAWRSKWHAGLVLEDSDSDSSLSGVAPAQDIEQYSDEEPEMDRPQPDTVSTSSSELGQGADSLPSKTPSAVAAELARRLGAQTREVPEPQQEYSSPEPTVRKVYKPHQPAPGTIFPDEPPPLEPSDQSDDDIFAELHKNRPYANSDKARVPVDLFGHNAHYGSEEDGDIFNDIPEVVKKPIVQTNPSAKPKSTLFEDEPEPELFADKPPVQDVKPTETESKKPIGGISLFGTNKTSESIGAAILKRNQRRSSTSGEESATDDIDSKLPAAPQIIKKPEVKKGNEMFDELFAKSKKMQQKNVKKEEEVKKKVETEKKVDLFSDNLFDDIDDIFSTNIVAKVPLKEPVKREKSIFDDEDDLFADIPTTKPTEAKTKNAQDVKAKNDNVKSIFDSDDDLFSENSEHFKVTEKAKGIISEATTVNPSTKISQVNKVSEPRVKESKSLFDSDDDIFSEVKTEIAQEKPSVVSKPKITKNDLDVRVPENNMSQNVQETKTKNDIFVDEDDDLFLDKPSKEIKTTSWKAEQTNNDFINKNNKPKPINKSPNLFDDEDEDSDNIFSSSNKPIENASVKSKDIIEETKISEVETSQTRFTDKNDIFIEPGSPAKISSKEKSFTKPNYIENEDAVVKDKPILSKTQGNIIFNKEKVDDFSSNVFEEKTNKQDKIAKEEIESEESQGSMLEDGFKDNLLTKSNENKQAQEKPQTHKPVIAQKPNVDHKIKIKEETSKPKEVFIQRTVQLPKGDSPEVENKEIAIDPVPRVEVKAPLIPDPDNEKENKNVIENINDQTYLNKPDLFTDIFNDQPPEFEKPKEPKRSKNVNALFDDDSDDEALFFRKTDPTLDEKPEDFSPKVSEDRLFGIFHDEPPAIDVDFEQKAEKVDIFNHEVDDFLDKLKENKDIVDTANESKSKEDKTASASLPELPKVKKEVTNVEPKKIGKLKPMNFNINVNTLLPGSSPKKAQKSNEQIDGQASSKSNEELHTTSPTTEEAEPKLVKSISFEGDPESNVLDNKLSKERPKIQVKRRPSTRRARREAVKKSGIDFGEDSTDNSSSIDDAPRVKNDEHSTVKISEKSINSDFDQEIIRDDDVKEPVAVKIDADNVDNSKLEEKSQESPVSSTKVVYILNDEDIFSDMKPTPKVEENKHSVTKHKILNIVDDDDDIFKNITTAKPENVEPETANEVQNTEPPVNIGTLGKVYTESAKTENIFDNDEDIFRGFSKTESKTDTAITEKATKSEPVQETKPSKSKSSIFDDLSDEENELFNTKKADTSKTIFNSDSEEELFSSKIEKKVEREEVAVKREIKHVEVKGSLFGDDDDDDLFGVKAKATEPVPQTKPAPREASSKPTEPVFEDPLSLLGGEDD